MELLAFWFCLFESLSFPPTIFFRLYVYGLQDIKAMEVQYMYRDDLEETHSDHNTQKSGPASLYMKEESNKIRTSTPLA
jgi:hypothetical protein